MRGEGEGGVKKGVYLVSRWLLVLVMETGSFGEVVVWEAFNIES